KTHTLVERCLACLLNEEPRASLDEILMVTFTEAAAAEMRLRIRARLEAELAARPNDIHWQEQLASFERASISTLHGFCFKLIREHFYQLELDPQLTVLAEEEARLLANETLDALLQKHYAGEGPDATAVQQLIQSHGRGWDKPIRALILRLHNYAQTLPNPDAWTKSQIAMFERPEPETWQEWLAAGAQDWVGRWRPVLKTLAPENRVAAQGASLLASSADVKSRQELSELLANLETAAGTCPHGKKTAWLKPLEKFFDEVRFLSSLAENHGPADPLAEDWSWVRTPMLTLVRLAEEFGRAFGEAKHELGVVDFHDLEQHALRLLWDFDSNQPTAIARQWRSQLRFVFVDEYQDINAAQDKIIQALSRDGAQANRFLVGDIKQSIYRFRLANPRIFQEYVQSWTEPHGVAIPLVENFRSREGLLQFVNSLFSTLMRSEVGGVAYGPEAQLCFGSPGDRGALSVVSAREPCVELHLRLKGQKRGTEDEETGTELADDIRDLDEADKEARLVALRLRELHTAGHPVWDETARAFRPVGWGDMAILLRSPAGKAERYAKEFARLGVPLQVQRGGFYQSLEISDLVSLLQVLDNPLQDIPVLAVLHSPFVGVTLDELASIRLEAVKTPFWTALLRWHDARSKGGDEPARRKVATFLERFARWRRLARQVSLSRCLEAVLSETHYAEWLLTQVRGEQRYANVQRLMTLAQQFDQFQRQGLFRFLRFIEAQQMAEAEPSVAQVTDQNAVRLMSIHQSKGLEFPVVVVADLGKAFNVSDLRA
ncbi:MAG TPA: UvrD-helicase domain-containing protein, partial [Verrucomicrobiae bacterium]|nr:UvrD-helicase domain-containing protein [Verrucomicrobiae bacterium]